MEQKKPNTQKIHALRIHLIKVQKKKKEISSVTSWDSDFTAGARALKSTKYTTICHQKLLLSTFTGSFITELLRKATL